MKDNIQEQYRTIRETIKNNVSTIQSLVEQAERLRELIEKITDKADLELKESLSKTIEGLHDSIQELIKHTNLLFEQYDKLADSLLK